MTDNESSDSPKLEELDLTELHIDRDEEAATDQVAEEGPASPPVPEQEESAPDLSMSMDENENPTPVQQENAPEETRKKSDDAMEKLAKASRESTSPDPEEPHSSEKEKKPAEKSGLNFNTSMIKTASIPFVNIAILILVLVIIIAGVIIYLQDSNALKLAETYWQQTTSRVQNKEFKTAKQSALTARAAMDKVLLLRSRKNALEQQISTLLNSTDFKHGLLGQVKYKDTYLPPKVAAQLTELEKLTAKADVFLQEKNIKKALDTYRKASEFARQNELTEQEKAIRQTLSSLNLEETMARAEQAEKAQDWENAAATYQRALELSKTLSENKNVAKINKKLAAISFHHALDQAQTTFRQSQWQQTIDTLENAKKMLAEKAATVSAEERREFKRLLANSQLYRILALARQAYENQQWDMALQEYQKSLDLLKDKQDAFAGAHENAVAKIKKTMLMIKIAREQNAASKAEQQNDMQAALTHYKVIEQLITESGLSEDTALLAVEKKTRAWIRSKVAQLEMDNNISWLNEHFETIFKNAYPSSRSSQLSHPKVTFIKETQGNRIFNITCLEQSGGSSFRLELNYQYNPARKVWSIFNDQ